MKASSFEIPPCALGLSTVVDVFDDVDLFRLLDNDEVLRLSQLGGATGFSNTKAIQKSTGVDTRRVLRSDVRPLDLAERIVRRLQHQSGVAIDNFDHVLLCHSHTDPFACRNLAADLAVRLGVAEHLIEPFNFGCAGFLKLLTEADLRLRQSEPGAKVAVISVETPEFWHDAADRLFCGIVSAGATAAVVEVGNGLPIGSISSGNFVIPTDRRPNPDPLFTKDETDVFDFDGQPCHRTVMRMNAEPVFLNGIELMLQNLREALESLDHSPGERIIVAPHQPSGKLLKALLAAGRAEFPQVEFLNNLAHYGNTISSSVPTLVSRLGEVLARNELRPLRNGDHVILLAAGICMADISDFMSAGHACLRWSDGLLNAAAVSAGSRSHLSNSVR